MLNANIEQTASDEQTNNFVLTNEAARELGVSPQTIRIWERRGHLHAIKTTNGVRLFLRRDIARLARDRAHQAGVR